MPVIILLTQGLQATVDDEDFGLVNELWRVNRSHDVPYAVTGTPPEMMHRRIAKPKVGQVVDHINGDTLDNRRSNLRCVSPQENKLNTRGARRDSQTGILGVSRTPYGTWVARIMLSGKSHYLGTFPTAGEAERARLQAEKRLHGVQPRRTHLHG